MHSLSERENASPQESPRGWRRIGSIMTHIESRRGRRGSILYYTLIHHHGVACQDDFVVRIIDHQVAADQLDSDVLALFYVTVLGGGDDGGGEIVEESVSAEAA